MLLIPFLNPNPCQFSPSQASLLYNTFVFPVVCCLFCFYLKEKLYKGTDVLIRCFARLLYPADGTPKLIPEEGSTYYHRVQHYRELMDSLQMDAYTHGCILHPEITVDSHIPAYAASSIRSKTHGDGNQQEYAKLVFLYAFNEYKDTQYLIGSSCT